MKKLPLMLSTCALVLACGSTTKQPTTPLLDITDPQAQEPRVQYHPSTLGVQMDLGQDWYNMNGNNLKLGSDLVFWNGKNDLAILVSIGDDFVDSNSFRDPKFANRLVEQIKQDESVTVSSMKLTNIASGDPAIEIRYVFLMKDEPEINGILAHHLLVGKNNLAYNVVCIGVLYDESRNVVVKNECDAALKTLKINY
jgi:hypothetical protein